MNLIDTPTHAKSHKIRVWSIRERGIHINNSFQATPWSSFTMICYAECFNTLINIFKVFHEPLLKALLPFIELSAFYKGKISSAPQTNRGTAPFNQAARSRGKRRKHQLTHQTFAGLIAWAFVLLKSKINWNKLCSLCNACNRKGRWPPEICRNCSEESLPHSPFQLTRKGKRCK